MLDLRRTTRIPLDGPVTLKVPVPGSRLRLMRAYLDDISLGGARLYAEDEVDVDESLGLRVRIPWSGRLVQGTGRVRHVKAVRRAGRSVYALGVEFVDINRDKVRGMIDDKLGGGPHKFAAARERKRELGLLLKLAPLLIIGTWLLIDGAFRTQGSMRQDKRFAGEFRQAVLHFLYNSK
ncbi:MAG: PilZ domain-containing protein [Deltaproteobacteria bacterium]